MGPNGIGKSTLIKTLAGLQPVLSGEVNVLDKHQIGLVLTDKLAASNLTVFDLVSFGRYPFIDWNLKLRSKDLDIIHQAIEMVHIDELKDKKIAELSDGQLQMAMIAKALAQDTTVLLLDEPTAHLDLNNRVEVMNLLRTISRQQNKATLIATHELDLALQTADRIWLTMPDRQIKTGIPEDLVLDGSFDEVFRFKGFDLKTGKVHHEAYRQMAVHLIGEGHEFLWTKNALERNGFSFSPESNTTIMVKQNDILTRWILRKEQFEKEFDSIALLLQNLL